MADVDAETDGDASSSDDGGEGGATSSSDEDSTDREGILRRRSGRARAPVQRFTPAHGRDGGGRTTRRQAAEATAAAGAGPEAGAIAGRYPRRDRGAGGGVDRFSPPREDARGRALAIARRQDRGYGSYGYGGGGWDGARQRGGSGEDGGWGGRGRTSRGRGGSGWGDGGGGDEVPDRPAGASGPAWGALASSAAAWLAAGGAGPPWRPASGGGHNHHASSNHQPPPRDAPTTAVAAPAATAGGAADITPLTIDPDSVSWDSVGGLDPYVRALKEMVFLPLAYPDLFARFRLDPPRGVLFHGPPGTGKTLVARALAASAARAGRPVAFFMRKGGDVLSKWVGEAERQVCRGEWEGRERRERVISRREWGDASEGCSFEGWWARARGELSPKKKNPSLSLPPSLNPQLRALFDAAARAAPSIIFFDEIDGLAPVRSSKQDQVHASIVSTLLALMDGLDPRGAVVVVGATNRPDALDPALRRPGRFDRELLFPLPNEGARAAILRIHTKDWATAPDGRLVAALAARTGGFGGADLKALCTEAALRALRRTYPAIYESEARLAVVPADVAVTRRDFLDALGGVTPASARSAAGCAAALPAHLGPSLGGALVAALASLRSAFAPAAAVLDAAAAGAVGSLAVRGQAAGDDDDSDEEEEEERAHPQQQHPAPPAASLLAPRGASASSGRSGGAACLIAGPPGCGAPALAAALLHALEGLPTFSLGLPALLAAPGARSPEEAVVSAVGEARRAAPSILYLPSAATWWGAAPRSLRAALEASLAELPRACQVLVVSVAEGGGGGEGGGGAASALPPAAAALLAPPGATTVIARLATPSDAGRAGILAGPIADAARPPDRRRAVEGVGVAAAAPALPAEAGQPSPPPADAGAADRAAADAARAASSADAATLRALRVALRDIATRLLLDKRWRPLAEPPQAAAAEEEDELEAGGQARDLAAPATDGGLYLATLLARVDARAYPTAAAFLADVATLPDSAALRARAAGLGDAGVAREVGRAHGCADEAAALVAARVPPALEDRCAAMEAEGGPTRPPPPAPAAAAPALPTVEEEEAEGKAATPPPPPPPPPPARRPALPPPSAGEQALAASTLAAAVFKSAGWTLDATEAAAAAMWGVCRGRRAEADRADVCGATLRAAGL